MRMRSSENVKNIYVVSKPWMIFDEAVFLS